MKRLVGIWCLAFLSLFIWWALRVDDTAALVTDRLMMVDGVPQDQVEEITLDYRGGRTLSFVRDVLGSTDMDEQIFGPLWGLSGREAYWDRGSADSVLGDIRRTTLIVHAEDDPICPVSAIPLAQIAANPHLLCAVTRHGGHMGYTGGGLSPLRETWNDRLFMHFLRHLTRRAAGHDADPGAPRPPPATPFSVFAGTPSKL